jgi:hypothetical protein
VLSKALSRLAVLHLTAKAAIVASKELVEMLQIVIEQEVAVLVAWQRAVTETVVAVSATEPHVNSELVGNLLPMFGNKAQRRFEPSVPLTVLET